MLSSLGICIVSQTPLPVGPRRHVYWNRTQDSNLWVRLWHHPSRMLLIHAATQRSARYKSKCILDFVLYLTQLSIRPC